MPDQSLRDDNTLLMVLNGQWIVPYGFSLLVETRSIREGSGGTLYLGLGLKGAQELKERSHIFPGECEKVLTYIV